MHNVWICLNMTVVYVNLTILMANKLLHDMHSCLSLIFDESHIIFPLLFCFHLKYQIQILKELSLTMILTIPLCVIISTFLYIIKCFQFLLTLQSVFDLRYLSVALTPMSLKMPWNKFLLLMEKSSMSRSQLGRDVVLSSLSTGQLDF